MSDKKSRWAFWGVVLACTACCAVPIYFLVVGAAAGFSASLMSPAIREILICTLPLIIVGLVIYFSNSKKKPCCDSPQSNCNDHQCGVKNHD